MFMKKGTLVEEPTHDLLVDTLPPEQPPFFQGENMSRERSALHTGCGVGVICIYMYIYIYIHYIGKMLTLY